jgi:hypothetical protein
VTDFVREQFMRKGMIADLAIHKPGNDGDQRNHHAHILLTMREIGPDGFGPKVREWNDRNNVEKWREAWERTTNRYLERHGHAARIDRRSLEAQGIDREPTTHRGPQVDGIEHRGVEAEHTRENVGRQAELSRLQAELAEVEAQIAAERKLSIELNEAAIIGPGPFVGALVTGAAAKLKERVRDFIAPPPPKEPEPAKEPPSLYSFKREPKDRMPDR